MKTLILSLTLCALSGLTRAADAPKPPLNVLFIITDQQRWDAMSCADNAVLKTPNLDKPGAAGVGLGSQFAREVLKASPNITIGLIPCAVGGTTLDQWKAGGPLYSTAVARAKEAMKHGKLAGILWHQGESDSGNPKNVDSYADRFSVMIAQFRKDLQADKVPVVMGELIHEFKTNDSVNVALAAAAKKVPLCGLVSSEGLGKKALHFNAPDLRIYGKRYAVEYLKLATEAK